MYAAIIVFRGIR